MVWHWCYDGLNEFGGFRNTNFNILQDKIDHRHNVNIPLAAAEAPDTWLLHISVCIDENVTNFNNTNIFKHYFVKFSRFKLSYPPYLSIRRALYNRAARQIPISKSLIAVVELTSAPKL